MTSFKEYLDEQMQDSEFKNEYDALEQEFAVIKAMSMKLSLEFLPLDEQQMIRV